MYLQRNINDQEFGELEKFNWFIHFQHIRNETMVCKELIQSTIAKSRGLYEYGYFKQGLILREEGKNQEALSSFQTCLKLNPDSPENYKEIAKCLYKMRRYRLSLESYLEAENISKSPDWEIYHNAGVCLMKLGEVSRAKEYAHKAVQIGKHETSYSLLIKILTTEGDIRSAIAVSNAATETCPDSVDMLTESGLLYLKVNQIQHAFERLSSALALDPTCAKVLLGIGCITQSHGEEDVALSKYKIAIQYHPDSVALWNNIGMCFYSKQKYIAAISCLKRALWISPLNWKVLYNVGLVHLSTNQSASAFNFLCAAVNLRPDVSRNFNVLGCALFQLNDPENALLALRQAHNLLPDDAIIITNTILCYIKDGKLEVAAKLHEHLSNLIKEYPDMKYPHITEVFSIMDNVGQYLIFEHVITDPSTENKSEVAENNKNSTELPDLPRSDIDDTNTDSVTDTNPQLLEPTNLENSNPLLYNLQPDEV